MQTDQLSLTFSFRASAGLFADVVDQVAGKYALSDVAPSVISLQKEPPGGTLGWQTTAMPDVGNEKTDVARFGNLRDGLMALVSGVFIEARSVGRLLS